MKQFFIKLKVVQKKKREGYLNAYQYRINPLNPLSYLVLILTFFVSLIGYGVVGMWEYVNFNPFKWQ